MTKKSYLSFSAILNVCVLVLLLYTTAQIKVSFYTDAPLAGIATYASGYSLESVFNFFGAASIFCFLVFVVKHIAEKRENNKFTRFALLLDLVVLALFLLLYKEQLLAKEFTKDPLMLGANCVCALTVILDLLSFPAERWG